MTCGQWIWEEVTGWHLYTIRLSVFEQMPRRKEIIYDFEWMNKRLFNANHCSFRYTYVLYRKSNEQNWHCFWHFCDRPTIALLSSILFISGWMQKCGWLMSMVELIFYSLFATVDGVRRILQSLEMCEFHSIVSEWNRNDRVYLAKTKKNPFEMSYRSCHWLSHFIHQIFLQNDHWPLFGNNFPT